MRLWLGYLVYYNMEFENEIKIWKGVEFSYRIKRDEVFGIWFEFLYEIKFEVNCIFGFFGYESE